MKRKIIAILVLSILCISTFSFAEEEDYPVILRITENHSVSCFDDVVNLLFIFKEDL